MVARVRPSLRRFRDEVGIADLAKQAKLEAVCSRLANTNMEGVPAAHLLVPAQRGTGLPQRHFGVNTVYSTVHSSGRATVRHWR